MKFSLAESGDFYIGTKKQYQVEQNPSDIGGIMTVSHTPGPWSAELLNKRQSNEHWRVGNAEAGNDIVAELMDYVSYPEERDKNAALISAAPDLLAACEAIINENVDEAYHLAALAIRKAKTVTKSLDQL